MSTVKTLMPLAAATCVSIVGMGMVIPMLPFQVTTSGGTQELAPLVFSAFSAAALVGAPIWGRLSDRFGRRPVLMLSIGAQVLSYIWLALATDIYSLFASRIFAGFTAGWLATSQAYVADVTSEEDRAKGMGLLGAAFGIGFTIGPGLGAWLVGGGDPTHGLPGEVIDRCQALGLSFGDASLGKPHFDLPAYAAAACAALGLLITMVAVKEPARHEGEAGPRFSLSLFRSPDLSRLLALYFMVFIIFTAIEGIFAVWAASEFCLGPRSVGLYLTFAGVVTVIVQGGIVRRLVPKIGEAKVVLIALAALAGALVALPSVGDPMMILLPMALLAIGMGLHNPAMQSLLSRAAPKGLRGGVMGTAQSSMSLARIIGPAWAALVFASIGHEAPFYIGLVLICIAGGAAMSVVRRHPHPAPSPDAAE